MKKILLTILIFFYSLTINAENNYDFRNIKWGMTIDEVIKNESLEIISNENDQLLFQTSILNKQCFLFYLFQNNKKLNSAGYVFQIKHTNPNDYIEDYLEIQNTLIFKYGEPIENNIIWKNNLYKNNQQIWGLAISMGHLQYQSIWETETTKILLSLYGDNYQNHLGIIYTDKNYISITPITNNL